MKKFNLNVNYLVADLVSQFNLGLIRKVRFIKVVKTPLTLRVLRILYFQGVIRTLRIEDDHILVFYKYINGQSICKLKIVSRPGKRSYWTLGKLALNYNIIIFLVFILFLHLKV